MKIEQFSASYLRYFSNWVNSNQKMKKSLIKSIKIETICNPNNFYWNIMKSTKEAL